MEILFGLMVFGVFGVIGLLLMVGAMLLRALIISQIWGWYIVPLFGLEPISMILAFGLSCFIGLFTMSTNGMKADLIAEKKMSSRKKAFVAIASFLALFVLWGMAAIGTLWLPDAPVAPVAPEVIAIEQVNNID